MKNTVIFASGNVNQLLKRLKVSDPNLQLIDGDIVTEDVRKNIEQLYPKQIEHTIKLRREKLSNELMKNPAVKLIVIDTTKAESFMLAVYEKSAEMHKEERDTVRWEISCPTCIENPEFESEKEVFLISGPGTKFDLADELLRQNCIAAETISSDSSVDEIDTQAISAVNSPDLTLITINSKIFKAADYAFHSRLWNNKKYIVGCIKILPNPDEEIEQVTTEEPQQANRAKVITHPAASFSVIETLAKEQSLTRTDGESDKDFAKVVLKSKLNLIDWSWIHWTKEGKDEYKKQFEKKVFTQAVKANLIPENFEETLS